GALGGRPEARPRGGEMLRLLLPTLRADLALCETYAYTPEAPLTCPITAFGGTHDPRVGREALTAWRHLTDGPFALRLFPGDHFFLHGARAAVLESIARYLTCH